MKKLLVVALFLASFNTGRMVADSMAVKIVLEGRTLFDVEKDFTLDEFEQIGVSETDGSIYIFEFKVTEDIEESVTIFATLSKQNPDGSLDLIQAPIIRTAWNDQALIAQTNNTTGENISAFILQPKR